ncbi:polymeric immunoglobulin receptor-like isoform X1 [Dicentrarchus labrax]|uniref:polymeric immunoglobulin receptor-like isoform X1 n=1 Tax=Dicentrarchus labrax TaxID=13489 RepID=UPI0021F6368D|nr:polymeric immunoglobulin receptor-like isoform X1 [Dicentrarchus labrax]
MALHLSVLLIFTGLTGIHSITTVSKVSVKAGGSISIPCLYEPEYTHHVKHLCKGSNWGSRSCKVKTDQPDSSGKFSISDDKQQRIFTVTINNLMMDDTDYWCVVEINDLKSDVKLFQLSVTGGWPQLFVDHQEITGFNGEDVTIHGSYSNTGEIEWCRLGGSCVKEPSGSIDGTRVTINANVSKVFTVTMSGLRTESSGWYFCTKGLLQMPVHVTVKERPSTTTRRLTTFSPTAEPVNHTAVSAFGEPTTVQGGNHRASIYPLTFIIPLSLLIFIVMVASFIWFMLRRHKQTKAPASAATAVEEEVSYSAVEFKRKALVKVEAADEDVTYSTLALQ